MWRISLDVTATEAERAEALLSELLADTTLLASSRFETEDDPDGPWRIDILVSEAPDFENVTHHLTANDFSDTGPHLESVGHNDWIAESLGQQPAIRLGRFWIHGSHETTPAPARALALSIDAGLAFGTGRHESTKGCLRALESMQPYFNVGTALDLGCGSGILGMAASRLWNCRVIGVEIDADAAAAGKDNARFNRLQPQVQVIEGSGLQPRLVSASAPYDLITMNILATPIIKFAARVSGLIRPGGRLILAGFKMPEEYGVINAYRAQGFRLATRVRVGGWSTLVLVRA